MRELVQVSSLKFSNSELESRDLVQPFEVAVCGDDTALDGMEIRVVINNAKRKDDRTTVLRTTVFKEGIDEPRFRNVMAGHPTGRRKGSSQAARGGGAAWENGAKIGIFRYLCHPFGAQKPVDFAYMRYEAVE
jgi:hypothetical protein